MIRMIPSGSAVAAVILVCLASSTTVLAQGGVKSSQRPVACDCTNCSAEHCQPKLEIGGLKAGASEVLSEDKNRFKSTKTSKGK